MNFYHPNLTYKIAMMPIDSKDVYWFEHTYIFMCFGFRMELSPWKEEKNGSVKF